jgi:class 3 adenylate cyclase
LQRPDQARYRRASWLRRQAHGRRQHPRFPQRRRPDTLRGRPNAGSPSERRIEFRVGIYIGDVVEESDGDLMDDCVNIAARLEGVAEAGGTCISDVI